MSDLLDSDLVKFLIVVFPLAFVGSRVSSFFYRKTLSRLRDKYGGTVRDRWTTPPEFVLPQPGGDIVVTSTLGGGSRASETSATAYFGLPAGCQFNIESNDTPHGSITRAEEHWSLQGHPDFSRNFRAYGIQPAFLGSVLAGKAMEKIESFLDNQRSLRIRLDYAPDSKARSYGVDSLARLVVATGKTLDVEATEGLLDLCILIRNELREPGLAGAERNESAARDPKLKSIFR